MLARASVRPLARRAILLRSTATTSSSHQYVPGGPIPRGTVNDSLPFPESSRSEGSYHWAFERLLSASLIPLTISAFVTSGSHYPILDGVLGMSLVVHSHIGFDAVVADYLHTRKFPVWGNIAKWGLRLATATALVGVYQFNTDDIGLTELIVKIWKA